MISVFDNCLFIHIPKVAGQSIESVFLERAGLTWQQRKKMLLRPNSDPKLGPPRLAHLTAQEYVDLDYLTLTEFNTMFKFAFVRNPWDRLVSEYTYRHYSFSFKSFVFNNFPKSTDDDYVKGFDGYRHVISQHKYLYDKQGKLLVDFVGKFERLAIDFARVTKMITSEKISLPHRNQASKNKLWFNWLKQRNAPVSYREYYDDETRNFVAELYQKDIKLFGYEF